ncbi:MAG TPA: hypothetical protein VG034_01815 [Acidimicrobiia bacterium]|jgi:hypothetical protein|nr:hypothetical protein [Acidimicrobiia bacterium]
MGEQLLDGSVTIHFCEIEGSTDLRTERGGQYRLKGFPDRLHYRKVGAP